MSISLYNAEEILAPLEALQEILSETPGGTRERTATIARVRNPKASTPATFRFNWHHSENGPSDIVIQPSTVVCMGIPKTAAAGKGCHGSEKSVKALFMALQILQREGYSFNPPERDQSGSVFQYRGLTEQERQKEYFDRNSYEEMAFCKNNSDDEITVTMTFGWIILACRTEATAALVQEKLEETHFALTAVPHEQDVLQEEEGVTISYLTGGGTVHDGTEVSICAPGTLFTLNKFGKTICKCLCSYHNGEMGNAGPTIEIIETAGEWQCHGYARMLLYAVQDFFRDMFEAIEEHGRVKWNVCHVTNYHALQWFLRFGFDDWDGMGEELGKYLFDD